MIQALVIALVALLLAHDSTTALPVFRHLPDDAVWLASLIPFAFLALAQHVALLVCGRMIDRTGARRPFAFADTVRAATPIATVAIQGFNIIVLGWLLTVRHALGGDYILIDEALATLPPLLVIIGGWASYYPIDRRIREASLFRSLGETGRAPSLPSAAGYVLDQARHHLLVVLVPISVLLAWTELVDRALPRVAEHLRLDGSRSLDTAAAILHILGVAAVLLASPVILRLIWSTTRLGPGPLRERILAVARAHGVRCRDLLVWRTHSDILNGAVVGIVPWLRYILLTQALLESLPPRQVEAVMAHEVAHARRHHLPWLVLAMLVTVSLSYAFAATGIERNLPPPWRRPGEPTVLAAAAGLAIALAASFITFGWISRRFEEQADAFAAQHLSGLTRGGRDDGLTITADAASTMADALASVAALNNVPPSRFGWRHGSIRGRQVRLLALIGLRANSLPIDRTVSIIKGATLLALAALLALWWAEL
jgi:Zn-dependent protease with chaperone function